MQYDESEICNDLRSPSRAHASGCVRRQIGRLIAERVASPGEELNEEFCSTPSTPPRPRAALYFPSSVGGPLSETFPQPRSAQGEKISHDGPSSPSTQFEASFDFAGVKSGSCTVRSGRLQRSHSDDGNRSPLPTSWHEPYSMDRTTQARDAVSAAVEGEAIRHPATPCDPNASLSPQLDFEAPHTPWVAIRLCAGRLGQPILHGSTFTHSETIRSAAPSDTVSARRVVRAILAPYQESDLGA